MNAAAIIVDDACHVLLGGTPERSARWHFPQGGIKPGEHPLEAALREVREEVGLRHCSPVAEFPGLRYEYRRKNIKSRRWLGQQQTYCLLRCPGIMPIACCSGSTEFSAAQWRRPEDLGAETFVAFKRPAVMQALAHYFPHGAPFSPERCTLQLYRHIPQQLPPAGTPLFAGGKAEAACHLSSLPALQPGKKDRCCVVLLGMQGAGLRKSLRHIAHTLDALTTRYFTDERRYAGLPPHDLLPLPGELTLLAMPADAAAVAHLPALAAHLRSHGVRTVSAGLCISRAKQLSRLSRKGKLPSAPYAAALDTLHAALAAAPGPGFLLPADHAWYRDYLLTLLFSRLLLYPALS